MLTDLHTHTSGISKCCGISAEDNLVLAKECGFDAVAITNHYTADYYGEDTYEEWITSYINEWNICKALGEKHGIRVFCGVEVSMSYDKRVHILIYGTDEGFLRENPKLCDMSLEELYSVCRKNRLALVQAHPYRGGTTVQNTEYLDGIEINCHPLYKNSFTEKILSVAKETSLAVTSGCDYHADTYRPRGGTYLPESVKTDLELAKWILTSDSFKMKIHEASDGEIHEVEYIRNS